MRLAADYQHEKPKKSEKDQRIANKQIVRLGRGLPQEEKRKRGISLSQENEIERVSLGREEVSREKIIQQNTYQISGSIARERQQPYQKVVTVASYGNREQHTQGYAAQHLLVNQVSSIPPLRENERARGVIGLKSETKFLNRHSGSIYNNASKVSIETVMREVYIPSKLISPRQSNAYSLDKNGLIGMGSRISQHQKIRVEHGQREVQEGHKMRLSGSKVEIRFGGTERNVARPVSPKIMFVRPPPIPKKSIPMIPSQKTEKIKANRDDPYSLWSSNMTRQYGQSSRKIQQEEELKTTRKQLWGVPQSKQVSNSLRNSDLQSSDRKRLVSLWDASKAESVISMQSEEVKMEKSSVVIDYFNPSESLLRKI